MRRNLEATFDILESRGVTIVDRRQTYFDEAVDVSRICSGSILHPGIRLIGARTFIGPDAQIGTEGPAILENTVVGQNAEIASGYLKEAVMLRGSRVGANAHIRPGTLLEEEASTAHAVGLKHTILMSFVTMGSLINFCDGLLSGGTSRNDHTEVGSGFIHFNFTPRGQRGDKATPTLVGDVVHGVFLRQPRIFLGGLSGIVGPQRIGFGSLTVAGQVLRREVPPNRIFGDALRKVDKEYRDLVESIDRVVELNLGYVGQLTALQAWYRHVRLARIPDLLMYEHIRIVTQAACDLLSVCIEERAQRLRQYLEERRIPIPSYSFAVPPCPLRIMRNAPYRDHIEWVTGLADADVQSAAEWLQCIARVDCR